VRWLKESVIFGKPGRGGRQKGEIEHEDSDLFC
jgi:hypothetical protein